MNSLGWNVQEGGNNTQYDHGPVEDTIKEASNNQLDIGAIDMKVMIPCGWNSQREVRNV